MMRAAVFPISYTRRHIVNSVIPARRKNLEDLKKTISLCPHCGSLDLQHIADTGGSLLARIESCRQQRRKARTQREVDGWRAEEEGLRDALLKRDGTYQQRDHPPSVFERYVMGLEDGRALIRLGWMDCHWRPATKGKHVRSSWLLGAGLW